MNNPASKGSEPFALKVIIILMSLIYILGPMHLEVNTLLHTIVHTLEMPDTLLSHQNQSDASKIHTSNEHKNTVGQHEHKLIKIVESILEGADNGKESPDAPNKSHKVDKHVKIREGIQKENALVSSIKVRHNFIEEENKLCIGYPNGYKEPPQIKRKINIKRKYAK